jgi:hypothetical protein
LSPLKYRGWLLGAAFFHFILIVAVCCRDTGTAIVEGGAILPEQWTGMWQTIEQGAKEALGENLSKRNPIRQSVGAYLNAAGIEAGYGFFAPSIPGANELLFEIHYSDGRVEYEAATMRGNAAALRLASFLDVISRAKEDNVRQGLIKYLAYALWREHSDVTRVRAMLGNINFPSSSAFARGEQETYHSSHVYDFTFEVKPKN